MTILERPALKFTRRFVQAIKSQSVIPWFVAFFLLLTGIIYKEKIMSWILIVMGVLYFINLLSWAFFVARIHVLTVELDNETVHIRFQERDRTVLQSIHLAEFSYKVRGPSRSSYMQIHFMQREKIILRQYAFGPWQKVDLEALDRDLKLHGLRKPFGENL